jgi:Flp pilus assembly protein TadG
MLPVRFWNNTKGNVAPIFAFAAIPLLLAIGSAVDFSNANSARAALQTALDSTALALSKTASGQSAQDLSSQATNMVQALFTRTTDSAVTVTASYTNTGGSKLVLKASTSVPSEFLGSFGYPSMALNATATSTWGTTRLRVALVLDNTGSMAQGGTSSNNYTSKMDALKTASHNLLTQLQSSAKNPEDVYVSIVPFSKDVNMGSSNYSQSWLYWDDGVTTVDNYWDSLNGTCSRGSGFTSRSKCLAAPVCSKPQYTTQSWCTSNYGTWYTAAGTWTHAAHSTWNGCLTDRNQNYDTTNDAPVAGSTLFPPEQYSSCATSLIGLSNDWTTLSSKVDAMQPAGNTNQAIGLQMGWQSLTASPFTVPPIDPNYQYKTVIILLTDGLNTQDRWYTNASSIDTREEKTCANIKAAGITIYTVQVNTGSDPTSTLLQNCATDSNKFFLLTSSDGIVTTFNQIATDLTKLRLAQ